jgi:hypothetical protein
MNAYQTALHESNVLLVKECDAAPDAVNLISAFKAGIDRQKIINQDVEKYRAEQERELKGITLDRDNVQEKLIAQVLDICGAIHALAVAANNKEMMLQTDFSENELMHLKQQELIACATNVLNIAQSVDANQLAQNGISTDEVAELQTLIENYKVVYNDPRGAIIERSDYTRLIRELLAESVALRKNTLDKLAQQYKRKNPSFYLRYEAASNIIYKRSAKKNGADDNTTETK